MSLEITPTQRFIDHLAGRNIIEHIGDDFLGLDEEKRRVKLLEYAKAFKIDPETIDIELLVKVPEGTDFERFLGEAHEKAQPKPKISLPDPREGLNLPPTTSSRL